MLAGFLVGILVGIIARTSWVFTLGLCAGITVYSIIDRGPREYVALFWGVETLVICTGAAVGYSLGYLAADRVALWLENRWK